MPFPAFFHSTLPISPPRQSYASPICLHTLTRRQMLHALPSLLLIPIFPSQAASSTSLIPLIRVRDALTDLSSSVSEGTNLEVRSAVALVLRGNDLPFAARVLARDFPSAQADLLRTRVRDAYEYLDQVIQYYDSTLSKQKLRPDQLKFCLNAVDAAASLLDDAIAMFDEKDVKKARDLVYGPTM